MEKQLRKTKKCRFQIDIHNDKSTDQFRFCNNWNFNLENVKKYMNEHQHIEND